MDWIYIFLIPFYLQTVQVHLANCVMLQRRVADRLCGLVRAPDYRSKGPGSIPGATNFLRSSGSGTESTQPREYNCGATGKKK
jgi:hypothetical protein